MRKLMLSLVLILTAVLITAGAFLPHMTGALMDHMSNEKVQTAPMQSVQLEFESSEQQGPENMLRKLAMRSDMYTVPIAATEAAMTEEEVYAAVERCMEEYVDAGIFQWFDAACRLVETYLCISPESMDYFSIIWTVSIAKEDDPYHNLFLHLDDETGKILYLDYVTYDPDSTFFPEDQAHVAYTFADIYFEQLGLTESADPFTSADVFVDEMLKNDVRCLQYTFTGTEYGDVTVAFYVKPNGFYILFPN